MVVASVTSGSIGTVGGAEVVVGLPVGLLPARGGLLGLRFPVGYLAVAVLDGVWVRPGSEGMAALPRSVVALLGSGLAALVAGQFASSTRVLLGVLAPLTGLSWRALAASVAWPGGGWLRFRRARTGWSPAISASGAA